MQYKAPQAINNMDDAGSKRQSLSKRKKERNKTKGSELDHMHTLFHLQEAHYSRSTMEAQVPFDKYIYRNR